jgi:carboxylesterase type B
VAAILGEAYSAEASVDAQLAYDSISTDYGLSCPGRVLAARIAASAPRPTHPVYLMYNAWRKSSTWGVGHWPYHALDLQEVGESWSSTFTPGPTDFAASAQLQRLVKDFAYYSGVLPQDWNWPPVEAGQSDFSTLVFAQDEGFPGGGVRAELNWKRRECEALASLGFGETYAWCD